MADPNEQPERQAANLLRRVLRQRRAGKPVEIEALGSSASADRIKGMLAALDRVEAARSSVENNLDDAESMLAAAKLSLDGFDLIRPLGIGGQGIIYQARRLSDGRMVAVKFMRQWKDANADDRRRFEREAKIQSDLNHPSIVPVLDFGRTPEGIDYLVMPFVDGRSLKVGHLLSAKPLDDRLRLFLDICRAVAAAHAHGIIHRDLKPGNILIDRDGRPHLVDFGIATHAKSESVRNMIHTTGKQLGTYLWCSYEQLDGKKELTPASDVFSLGVILHQFLCDGRFPPDVLHVMEAILEQEETRPTSRGSLSANLRADLAQIINRCLEREPSKRYADAGQLAFDIEKALDYCPPRSRRRFWIGAAFVLVAISTLWMLLHREQPVVTMFNRFGRPPILIETSKDDITRMHYLAPGTFMMGASPKYLDPLVDEAPHQVVIEKGFYIANHETTQGLYESLMESNPSRFQGAKLPVKRVSYEDAVEFCRRLSKREGHIYRLPTEAEWEYACRAGSTTIWDFGDDANLMIRRANIADLSNTEDREMNYRSPWNDGHSRTAPVASFISNEWQLHDMHGNVWEWCQAPYVANPLDAKTAVPNYACVRGGSWWDDPNTCRSSNRNPQPVTAKISTIGFRIVCEAE